VAGAEAKIGIVSPLTGGAATRLRAIETAPIREAYLREHKCDVSAWLPPTLTLCRCDSSGMEFFAEKGVAGPPAFYEALYSGEGAGWGYRGEKWEFAVGARLVAGAKSALDIGSGGGDFLAILKSKGIDGAGLETSAYGRAEAGRKGVVAYDETIATHAASGRQYDAVTAFQVLEHVEDPRGFLDAACRALRPGGVLVVSVPNNDSFLKDCPLLPLNLPPHHVTFWPRRALEHLTAILPLDLAWIEKEPLQQDNLDWYQAAMEARFLPTASIARSLYARLGARAAFRRYLEAQRETIDGHTILAAYRKRA
jgi:2-polyprenyl-3-methyl-5-hydroxy-6-metoxy-1,4-benzoquinol methylase